MILGHSLKGTGLARADYLISSQARYDHFYTLSYNNYSIGGESYRILCGAFPPWIVVLFTPRSPVVPNGSFIVIKLILHFSNELVIITKKLVAAKWFFFFSNWKRFEKIARIIRNG